MFLHLHVTHRMRTSYLKARHNKKLTILQNQIITWSQFYRYLTDKSKALMYTQHFSIEAYLQLAQLSTLFIRVQCIFGTNKKRAKRDGPFGFQFSVSAGI